MERTIICIVKMGFQPELFEWRTAINKLCTLLASEYAHLKYKASKVLPSVSIDAYEISDEEVDDLVIRLRKLDYLDTVEKVTN